MSRETASIVATAANHSALASISVVTTYDLDALGVPRLVTHSYIDLDRIQRVSRFRSGIGHDYSDEVEHCRSMKHYFQPYHNTDWGTVTISAPMDGTIIRIDREQTLGVQLRIEARDVPAATVVLFHVKLDSGRVVGEQVVSGMRLGTHIGSATMSDVALELDTPSGRRLVSYFDAMTDSTLAAYQARGVPSRSEWSITVGERNAFPLSCDGEAFRDEGAIPNWVELR
ncbi:MAG: hypothetical protein ABI910_17235 [Gemmatimonadota bacterium]